MHPSRHWYAGWDLGRRLLLVLAYYIGVYLDASLLAVRDTNTIFYNNYYYISISAAFICLWQCYNVPCTQYV